MNTTNALAWHDLQWCLRRAPRKLLEAMKKHGRKVMVAGGYVRACVTNDHMNDVDVFVPSKDFGKELALELAEGDEKRIHSTDNAFTIKGYRHPIQIIHRWLFDDPQVAILSFDFTIARAAFWWTKTPTEASPDHGKWESCADSRFYPDLAGKRLIYCEPVRIEEAGGSLLRVLKFYQRGYRIPLNSFGAVIARLISGVRLDNVTNKGREAIDESQLAKVLTGLLREVDPNIDPTHVAHLPSEEESAPVAEEAAT